MTACEEMAAKERAEADAAREELERAEEEVAKLEEDERAEQASHAAVVEAAQWERADSKPPEELTKKKKQGFGRGFLKKVLGSRDKALPAALHARVLGTYRPEEEFGNDAMLLTLELKSAINLRQLIPLSVSIGGDALARQLEDRDVRLYCTACVCGAADEEAVAALPSSGQTAAAREHTEATSHALLEQDGGVGWGERVQLRTGEISQERVVCGVYMQVEGERNDRKVASVSIGLRRYVPPLILGVRDDTSLAAALHASLAAIAPRATNRFV